MSTTMGSELTFTRDQPRPPTAKTTANGRKLFKISASSMVAQTTRRPARMVRRRPRRTARKPAPREPAMKVTEKNPRISAPVDSFITRWYLA
jgi:hypothetical protein